MAMRKRAIVESVEADRVVVRWGPGVADVENLMGIAKPQRVKVGDVGSISFHATPGHALWFWSAADLL